MKPIVAASDSVTASMSPPAISTASTTMTCEIRTSKKAASTTSNGDHTGTPSFGSASSLGGAGAPSGRSGRDGSPPGCS